MANKRGANGGGSIRQRPDGRWEARVTVGNDPATGKIIRRSIYGDSQKEVRQQMTAVLKEIDRGTYQTPNKMTVAVWLDEWLKVFVTPKAKPLTLSTYRGIINNHIKPQIGAMELQAVRGAHIQKIYNAATDEGLAGKTVKSIGGVLHKAFSVAIKQGIIFANPCDGAELPKIKKHEISPLTDEDIPKFLGAIEESPLRNIYALCLFCGLREGEALGLSWKQVDFKKRRITISQQLQRSKEKGEGYYIQDSTKGGRTRVIEPPAIAFEYLRDEQERQFNNRVAAGDDWHNDWNLVFTNEIGGHIAIHTFYKRFKAIAESIGRPDLRPHDMRHTCATVAIANGADIKSVQDLLGHATASFTLNVYAHTSEAMMKDTAERVQSYYDNLTRQA